MCNGRCRGRSQVFQRSLQELAKCSGTPVPAFLADVLRWLACNALREGSIFSTPVDSVDVEALRFQYDATGQLQHADLPGLPLKSSTVAGLLKRWLADLPEPALPADVQMDMQTMYDMHGSCPESLVAGLRSVMQQVDPLHLSTLRPLLLFLQQYSFRQNDYDLQLKALVEAFAPLLLPDVYAHGASSQLAAKEIISVVISKALLIFGLASAATNSSPVQQQPSVGSGKQTEPRLAKPSPAKPKRKQQKPQPHPAAQRRDPLLPRAQPPVPRVQQQKQQAEVPREEESEELWREEPAFQSALTSLVASVITSALFGDDEEVNYNQFDMPAMEEQQEVQADAQADVHIIVSLTKHTTTKPQLLQLSSADLRPSFVQQLSTSKLVPFMAISDSQQMTTCTHQHQSVLPGCRPSKTDAEMPPVYAQCPPVL